MHDPPAIMRQDQEDEKQAEGCGGDNEEVSGNNFMHVILQKRFPGLRERPAGTDHVLGYRGFANVDAKFLEFAMNARCAPAWIGQAYLADQSTNRVSCLWAAITCLTLPCPVQSK